MEGFMPFRGIICCSEGLYAVQEGYIEENTSLAAPGALTHRLHRRTACLIQNGRWGLEICQTLSFWIEFSEVLLVNNQTATKCNTPAFANFLST